MLSCNRFALSLRMGLHTRQGFKYEEAVAALNDLQSNAALIAERRRKPVDRIETIKKFLVRSGVSLERLDTLSVIHVTGTKGKGSTCALCDSALRSQGVKTGVYASPHLIEVRERIRLAGFPISRDTFAKYFWKIYNKLNDEKESANDMPPYFQFLTIMAFNVFLEEKVDVAIIEVGIGGAFDSTNVLRRTDVAGITSIGYDHMMMLGDTLAQIAWQKAGILKPGCRAFTSLGQPLEAARMLRREARERNVPLFEVPPLSHYTELSPWVEHYSPVTKLNASLALQLAWAWLSIHRKNSINIKFGKGFAVPSEVSRAFADCILPGRAQHISIFNELSKCKIDLFLDGAHTPESAELCAKWFSQQFITPKSRNILIFNATGGRDPIQLLKPIASQCHIHEALFCPNLAFKSVYGTVDQVNLRAAASDELVQQSHQNALLWKELQQEKSSSFVFESVKEALSRVKLQSNDTDIKVLITGSLHLVGAVLAVLEMDEKDGKFEHLSQRRTILSK